MKYGHIVSFAAITCVALVSAKPASAANPAAIACYSYDKLGDYSGLTCGGEEQVTATCTKNPAVGAYATESCTVAKGSTKADVVTAEYLNNNQSVFLYIDNTKPIVGNFFAYNQIDCSDGSLVESDYCSNAKGKGFDGVSYNYCYQSFKQYVIYTYCPPNGSVSQYT